MTDESDKKFTERFPNPTGRKIVPAVSNLGEIMTIYSGLVVNRHNRTSESVRPPDLPVVDVKPYIPPVEQ